MQSPLVCDGEGYETNEKPVNMSLWLLNTLSQLETLNRRLRQP